MASESPSPSESPAAEVEPPSVGDAFSWIGDLFARGVPFKIAAIVFFAAISQWVFSRLIKRVVRRTVNKPSGDRREGQPTGMLLKERREQRAAAIGQLVRSVLAAFIWGIAILMILPLLGIDIAPLLASAGVIGVALGFGAQTLVKDYLSGIFMILEDQFGVGDMVDLGEAIGTVEEVTLRVTRLRDQTGVVWYVRNGEILRVANRSQGWTLCIIDIPVAYDEDLERVKQLVDQTADEMVDDPESKVQEFNRPEYAGVESVSGEAVYVRVIAKADPDDQVPMTRAIRQALKDAFDEAGVRVPVVFRVPGAGGGAGSGNTGAAR